MQSALVPLVVLRATGVAILSVLVGTAGFGLRLVMLANGTDDPTDKTLDIADTIVGLAGLVTFVALAVVGWHLLLADPADEA